MMLLLTYLSIVLAISFICSILEAVLLTSSNTYIESMSKDGNENVVKILKELKQNIDKPISSILTLNTFAHTMGAAGVGAQAQILFGNELQSVIAFILTLLILYVAEIVPKTIGAVYWKKLLAPSAYMIMVMMKITFPLVWFSSFITNYIAKGKNKSLNFSREEIMAAVFMGEKEGSILSKESYLIENLLKLKTVKAKDIMTPRSVVFALKATTTVAEAIEDDTMYIHSRIPVFTETLDDVIGVVFNQRILEESIEDHDDKTLEEMTNPVFRVSENVPAPTLIDLFVKRKEHLFIVHDSYGQTSGVVTLEDAIEALLGVEIVDEMDEVEDMQVFAKNKNKLFHEKVMLEKKRKSEKENS